MRDDEPRPVWMSLLERHVTSRKYCDWRFPRKRVKDRLAIPFPTLSHMLIVKNFSEEEEGSLNQISLTHDILATLKRRSCSDTPYCPAPRAAENF